MWPCSLLATSSPSFFRQSEVVGPPLLRSLSPKRLPTSWSLVSSSSSSAWLSFHFWLATLCIELGGRSLISASSGNWWMSLSEKQALVRMRARNTMLKLRGMQSLEAGGGLWRVRRSVVLWLSFEVCIDQWSLYRVGTDTSFLAVCQVCPLSTVSSSLYVQRFSRIVWMAFPCLLLLRPSMFSTQAFSFRNDGDGVELRSKFEGEIFLSYILSDPQVLWILYS